MWITLLAHGGHLGGHDGLAGALAHSGFPYVAAALVLLCTLAVLLSTYRRRGIGS